MDESNPSFIKFVHPYSEAGKIAKYKDLMLSAIALDKGLREKQPFLLPWLR